MPLDNWNCESTWNWTLVVATARSTDSAYWLTAVECTQPPAGRMMKNCWNRRNLTLIMVYEDYADYSTATGPKEPLNMFRIVVTDLVDTEADLNRELEAENERESKL